MAKIELFVLVVPFIEWKIYDPAVGDFVGVFEIEMVGEGDAELTEDFVDFVASVGTEKDCIASLGISELCNGGYFGVGHEFEDGGFGAFVGV